PGAVLELAKRHEVRLGELKVTLPAGTRQHLGGGRWRLARGGRGGGAGVEGSLDEPAFEEGIGLAGSSIRGFQEIYESDMLLMPDPATAILDPFYEAPTISLVCTVLDPITREPYTRHPP